MQKIHVLLLVLFLTFMLGASTAQADAETEEMVEIMTSGMDAIYEGRYSDHSTIILALDRTNDFGVAIIRDSDGAPEYISFGDLRADGIFGDMNSFEFSIIDETPNRLKIRLQGGTLTLGPGSLEEMKVFLHDMFAGRYAE